RCSAPKTAWPASWSTTARRWARGTGSIRSAMPCSCCPEAERASLLVEPAVDELLERLARPGGVVALGDDLELGALGGGEEHHLHDGLPVHRLLAALDRHA